MDYKKFFRLHPGEYVQLHQEDQPRNTIDIDQTVEEIFLGPQYNLQAGYCFEILLTGKRLRQSHWTPINMNKYVIECYDTFNNNGFPDKLLFGNLNDQPIPYNYYNLLNNDDDSGKNIPGTPVDDSLPDNEGLEYAVVSDNEGINDEIIIYDDDRLDSDIGPLQNKMMEIEEIYN